MADLVTDGSNMVIPDLTAESLKAIDKAIHAIKNDLDNTVGDEFSEAGERLIAESVKDLKGGVSQISGDLQSSIMGDIIERRGVEQSARVKSTTSPYNYAGRLDRDGSLEWRSGKYSGRKTFGWFHYVLPKVIKKLAKRYYTKGLERGIIKLIGKIQ